MNPSSSTHNRLLTALVEQFAPRFAAGARLLHLRGTGRKSLRPEDSQIATLSILPNDLDKLPDVVLHDAKRGRLFLIEVASSHGAISPARKVELEALFGKAPATLIFVSAFRTRVEFHSRLVEPAWGTMAWMADEPDHLIHYE